VLIVEDEAVVARDLEHTLTDMGYTVTASVGTSAEALAAATARRPDVVLMDIRLRGERDGIDTARMMRLQWDLPVVYVTAFSDQATLARAAKTGAYGYVVKPFVASDVRCAIEIALHKHGAERQLATAARLTALGTMAAGAAHEINNPLTYMMLTIDRAMGLLDVIGRDARFDPERHAVLQHTLNDLGDGAERIRRIVADLTVFGRPLSEPLQLVDVRESVSWALRVTAHQTRSRVTVITDLQVVPPVEASDTRLGQVLVNLILNAVHALSQTPATSQEIRLRTFCSGDEVVVAVSDTGCGIAPEHLGRIFDPFFTTKDPGAGMGLGLAVCHGIVKALGGSLVALSAPGEGSTFELRLPVATRRHLDVDPLSPPEDERRQPPTRRHRLLVVEDEPLLLKVLKSSLREEHDVVGCAGASAALTVLRQDTRFDLVITDVLMPGMSGRDLYDAAVAIDAGWRTKMAFMTGGSKLLDDLEVPVIAKPFRVNDLQAWVRDLLAKQADGLGAEQRPHGMAQ
jgi:signal transduction histidine kinase